MNKPDLDAFFEKAPVPFACFRLVKDSEGRPADGEFLAANPPFRILFGNLSEELNGHLFSELFPRERLFLDDWGPKALQAIGEKRFFDQTVPDFFPGKSIRIRLFPVTENEVGCILRDVSTEAMLREEVDGFLAVSLDMFLVGTPEGQFVKVNRQFETVIGYSPQDLEGRSFFDFMHPEDVELTREALISLMRDGGIQKLINRFFSKQGIVKTLEWRAIAMGTLFYSSARDITDQVEKEAQLRKKAEIDPLTGLFNRQYLYGRIHEEIRQATERGKPLSMIAMDIDHFKYVNDIWGHPVGDEVLERTANLWKTAIRPTDFLARIGGEEFVALLPGTDADGAMKVARRMHQALNDNPHPRVGKVTASFGVAVLEPGEDFLQWYKRADEAVYAAKQAGRNRVSLAGEKTPVDAQGASIYMTWEDEWNCGNPTIDAQHRELVDVGNHLVFLAVSGASPHQISRQIDRLLVHSATHFSTEETLLEDLSYPELSGHRVIHKDLLRRTTEMAEGYLRSPSQSPIFLSFLINDLIIGHLVEEDRKFFPFLSSGK